MKKLLLMILLFTQANCSGLKVVNPEEEKERETKILDLSSGSPKIVGAYTCRLESMGNKFSATGKTEAEAKKEVVARCKDRTAISFCKEESVKCMAPK